MGARLAVGNWCVILVFLLSSCLSLGTDERERGRERERINYWDMESNWEMCVYD